MKKSLVFVLMVVTLIFTGSVFAQSTDEYNKGEFFVGYSSNSGNEDAGPSIFVVSRGVNVSGVYNIKHYIGIKGDVSLSIGRQMNSDFVPGFDNPTNARVAYSNQLTINNAVVGVQFKDNTIDSRFKPFGHIMVGVGQFKNRVTNVICTTPANCSNVPKSENNIGFATVIGGGLDIKINKRIDIRAAQVDLNLIANPQNAYIFGAGEGLIRFSSGIIVKF